MKGKIFVLLHVFKIIFCGYKNGGEHLLKWPFVAAGLDKTILAQFQLPNAILLSDTTTASTWSNLTLVSFDRDEAKLRQRHLRDSGRTLAQRINCIYFELDEVT